MKAQHPDAVLLFRMGDFYETFDEDAETAAAVLGIALTSRPMGKEGRSPLAGVPHHQLERYLDMLVAAGYRVAIADQVSLPPSKGGAPGLVERRVVRVVTPGTVDSGSLLTERAHNWLVAAAPATDGRWGIAACDVTTGELEVQVVPREALAGEWARLAPRELLLPALPVVDGEEPEAPSGARVTRRPGTAFQLDRARDRLTARLGVATLDGFGLEGLEPAIGAAGAVVAYLEESWPQALAVLRPPRPVRASDVVYLDPQTRRNLELFAGTHGERSLAETLDRTLTPMGARLFRLRLGRPLRRAAEVEARLDEVAAFVAATWPREGLRRALRGMPDLQRLLGRVRAGTAHAKHLLQLRAALERLPAARAAAAEAGAPVDAIAAAVGDVEELVALLTAALDDDAPAEIGEAATIRARFDAEVDRLRSLATDGRSALAALEQAERERTGIASLHVGYHRVFGYYLECSRAQAERAPADYEPRQALANTQRFFFAPLAALESEILGARDALAAAERTVLTRVLEQAAAAHPAIERAADAVARLDVAAALAALAVESHYVRPEIAEHGAIEIEGGRHPVVERQLPSGEFVPNDTHLGGRHGDIVVLTGPNMAGKSTYLRQSALLVLLAQAGSFVPAARARIPLVDRVFSRVGAQDDIAAGQSTFMVEMLETATILHNATERSLVILDEVGRGTSTYDGLAIARAIVEYLHHRPGGSPRTIFATHYHELTALSRTLPRVVNRSVAVREEHGEVVFLHQIVDGGADRSYGVHVAALAGLPRPVVARARELLAELEANARGVTEARDERSDGGAAGRGSGAQLSLLAAEQEALVRSLAALEPDALTPLEALHQLYELRAAARQRLGIEG